MSTEPRTTVETRSAQAGRLLAEKDARMRLERDRPLPAWLASRRNRRAVALVPILPLVGGLYAGTLPDTILRSTVMMAVAAVSVAAILLLRRSTRLLDAAPDRLLDEREIAERNLAYRLSHGLVLALLSVLALMAVADGVMRKVTEGTLVDGDGWIPIMLTAVVVGTMIPAAVLAWRYSEPFDDTDMVDDDL